MDPQNPERDEKAKLAGEKIIFLKRKKKSFGFSMATEAGEKDGHFCHLVKEVEKKGPAMAAGIQVRDRKPVKTG